MNTNKERLQNKNSVNETKLVV